MTDTTGDHSSEHERDWEQIGQPDYYTHRHGGVNCDQQPHGSCPVPHGAFSCAPVGGQYVCTHYYSLGLHTPDEGKLIARVVNGVLLSARKEVPKDWGT